MTVRAPGVIGHVQQVAWALSWRGCCNTDEGRAGGQQAGWAGQGQGSGTHGQGYLVESRGPTASSQMPIAQDGRCVCSLFICYLGWHGTLVALVALVDENSLALCCGAR